MKYFLLATCLVLSSTIVVASPLNEILETAIENSDIDTMELMLAQATLTQEEKQIFVQEAQEIIDTLNNNLAHSDKYKVSPCSKIHTGGIIATSVGLSVFITNALDYNSSTSTGLASIGAFLGGCTLIIWGQKSHSPTKDEVKKQLRKALLIKNLLLATRTKN